MATNIKGLVGLVGCVGLVALWFVRTEEPTSPAREEVKTAPPRAVSKGAFSKPKGLLLRDEPRVQRNADDSAKPDTLMMKDGLEVTSRKVRVRQEAGTLEPRAFEASTTDDDGDGEIQHWRNVLLSNPDPEERASAVGELDFDDVRSMKVVALALNDRDPEVRLAALEEISVNSDEPPLDILASVLDDPDPEVREEAVRLIAESEEPAAEALLYDALADANEDVSSEAEDALELLEDESLPDEEDS